MNRNYNLLMSVWLAAAFWHALWAHEAHRPTLTLAMGVIALLVLTWGWVTIPGDAEYEVIMRLGGREAKLERVRTGLVLASAWTLLFAPPVLWVVGR